MDHPTVPPNRVFINERLVGSPSPLRLKHVVVITLMTLMAILALPWLSGLVMRAGEWYERYANWAQAVAAGGL